MYPGNFMFLGFFDVEVLFCRVWITVVDGWEVVGYNGMHVGESGKLFTTFLLSTWDGQ